jgi:ABC-type branched-subunit amino acid transport system substrate-binding protein
VDWPPNVLCRRKTRFLAQIVIVKKGGKMFRPSKWVVVLTTLVAVAVLVAACGPKAPQVEDEWGVVVIKPGEKVRIGAAMALSGDLAVLGEDIKYGVDLVLEDIPDIKGFPVEIVYEDDMCTGEGGTAVGNKFAADPTILAVAGHM